MLTLSRHPDLGLVCLGQRVGVPLALELGVGLGLAVDLHLLQVLSILNFVGETALVEHTDLFLTVQVLALLVIRSFSDMFMRNGPTH